MLNMCPLPPPDLAAELRLRYWQGVLRLTRLAGHIRQWGVIFNRHRRFMAFAFLGGVMLRLIPDLL